MNETDSTKDYERVVAKLAEGQAGGLLLGLTMGPYDVWLAVAGLQLATRHPALPDHLRRDFEVIGRRITAALGIKARETLEAGWNPEHDQPVPGFRCRACGRVSYNPDDIANRYCGACHAYMN